MITFLIIVTGIAVLILIGKLINVKPDKNSNPKTMIKNVSEDNLLKKSFEKLFNKDYLSAIAMTDKILFKQPNNYRALTCRASSLEALNFNLDAIEDYEKALQIDKSDANIYGLLGLTYIKIGDMDSGQKNLKISIQMGLKLYEMHYNLLLASSDELKQAMIKRAKVPENLLKRNPNEFVEN